MERVREEDPVASYLSPADYCKLLRFLGGAGEDPRGGVVEVLERSVEARVGAVVTLSGLLFTALKDSSTFELLSPPVREALEVWAKESLGHTLRQEAVFCAAANALGERGIPVIPLKGTCFNSTLYANRYPRRCLDVDFLVTPEHYKEAQEILGEMYLHCLDPLVPEENAALLFEATFQTRGSPRIVVEVHNGFTHPPLFDVRASEMWDASVVHPVYQQATIRRLACEHHLIHLAVHGFRDLRVLSHSLLDSAELIRAENPDWHRLREDSRRWKTDVVLHAWLEAVRTLLGAPVPEDLLDDLEPALWRRVGIRELYRYGYTRAFRPKTGVYRLCQLLSLALGTAELRRLPEFLRYRRALLKGTAGSV